MHHQQSTRHFPQQLWFADCQLHAPNQHPINPLGQIGQVRQAMEHPQRILRNDKVHHRSFGKWMLHHCISRQIADVQRLPYDRIQDVLHLRGTGNGLGRQRHAVCQFYLFLHSSFGVHNAILQLPIMSIIQKNAEATGFQRQRRKQLSRQCPFPNDFQRWQKAEKKMRCVLICRLTQRENSLSIHHPHLRCRHLPFQIRSIRWLQHSSNTLQRQDRPQNKKQPIHSLPADAGLSKQTTQAATASPLPRLSSCSLVVALIDTAERGT